MPAAAKKNVLTIICDPSQFSRRIPLRHLIRFVQTYQNAVAQ